MDRSRLRLLLCASAAVLASPLLAAAQSDRDPAKGLNDTIAVQAALQQGLDLIHRREPAKAVAVLEAQLARIDGNRAYLATLRDAYRAHITQLFLANQTMDAQKYLERLRILDPAAAAALTPAALTTVSPQPTPAAQTSPVAEGPKYFVPAIPAARDNATGGERVPRAKYYEDQARLKQDDPFSLTFQMPADPTGRPLNKLARELLAQAEQEFGQRHYVKARDLFEKASHADRAITEASRDRWVYCKLNYVVEELNRVGSGAAAWSDLEQEVQTAIVLSATPRMADTGRWLLQEIGQRRRSSGGVASTAAGESAAVTITHGTAGGWQLAETANFRVFHNQTRDLAEQAARVAEQTRVAMYRKWFGSEGEAWQPKCDLYLHTSGEDYQHRTGVSSASPGHSRIEADERTGRVVARRIDLRCDNPTMLEAVLPHEATHVVLAGQFGKHPVPRWVDEGIAVLTEPADKVDMHRRNLAVCREHDNVFSVRELLSLKDYPQPARLGAFYAHSVSLVEFLTRQNGPQVFCRFINDGLREGYEAVLQRHYGFHSFAELESRWMEQTRGPGYAGR